MKRLFIPVAFIFSISASFSQNVGINAAGSTPNASAGLDVDFTNKGVLVPRVALTQTSSALPVTSPATSLLVYNTATVTDVTPGYYYWDGAQWVRLLIGSGTGAAWLTTGNSISGSEFIGTTSNSNFIVKTNNTEQLRVQSNGTLKITGAAITSPGIWMQGTVTAAATTAYGILSRGTLTAAANGDGFLPFSTNLGTVNTGTFTGLKYYAGHFDGSSLTKTGTGTIDDSYGLYVTATPTTVATNNYAGAFTGGNVGIGTTSPTGTLHVVGTSPNYFDRISNPANEGANIIFRKARGTVGSPSAVQNGDELGKWLAGGYDGSAYIFTGGMSAVVTGTVSAGFVPTDLVFGVSTALMGNPTSNEAMRITNTRRVGIGTTTPVAALDVTGATASGSFVTRITNTQADGEMLGCFNYLGNEGVSIRQDALGHSVIGICNSSGTRVIQLSSSIESYINSTAYFGLNTTIPTAQLDVNGTTGFNQIRMRTSFTPTGSADASGNTGDIAWDTNFFYVKTPAGWKRTALSAF